MRRPLIAGNWKLHKTIPEALELVAALKSEIGDLDDVDLVVAPPFTALAPVAEALAGSRIFVAAQNCHPEPSGAFTGEVSPPLLHDAGCRFVIVGHSERRQLFGEDDAFINRKVHALSSEGLGVIFCIGETLEERENGRMFDVLRQQVSAGLKGLDDNAMSGVVIAYEPVWAIGTGRVASTDQAQEAHAFIRELLGEQFGAGVADATRILYGGSVKPDNVDGLMSQTDIDGTLVGGASLKASDFIRIARFART